MRIADGPDGVHRHLSPSLSCGNMKRATLGILGIDRESIHINNQLLDSL